jgi:VIT1/CCC1 family predicted Fe2+/Mn2+ transporter
VAKPIYTPFKAGSNTFWAFLICGAMPLLPYLFPVGSQALIALILAGITFFVIGSIKSLWSIKRWYWAGLETMAIGLSAAGLAFAVGYGLKVLAL